MTRLALSLIGLGLGLMTQPASAQALRSDSPLWTYESEASERLFPRSFHDADSFGCVHTIHTGLYRRERMDSVEPELEPETDFWRLDNYGVFHCALLFGTGGEVEQASNDFDDYAWIVELDSFVESDGRETELLALQVGVRSGSEYILLRRRKGDRTYLEELAQECPRSAERRTARIDIWGQDVCVVTSQRQLRSIARAAHRRPIAARLEWIPVSTEIDSAGSDETDPVDTPTAR